MRDLRAQHLVVGGGLLGLAVADHLLRRGAENVVLLEASASLNRSRSDDPGLLVASGVPSHGDLEDRAFLLLEEWKDYLEVDPGYHRTGSIQVPPPRQEGDWERLDPGMAQRRYEGLCLSGEGEAAFHPRDGRLDGLALRSTLHWQIRRRGGQIHLDSELSSLTEDAEGFAFTAGSRTGRAEQVYLAAGLDSLKILRALGLKPDDTVETWHRFQLSGSRGHPVILRLGDGDQAVFYDDGEGEVWLDISAPPDLRQREPTLEWSVLEEFRQEFEALLPVLQGSRVRRGRAETKVAFDRRRPFRTEGERLHVAGGFGPYRLLLALAVGERMAERGLGLA